jgi:ParB family chromosome partitioning protein
MTTTSDISHGAVLSIPLSKLKASPRNARKTPHGEAAIDALAASIAAKGVLQPLIVEPELDGEGQPTGSFFVTIGEGRRQALKLLAKRKQISRNEPTRCIVDLDHDAHEISLDENITRTAMHPADQFEAFYRLAEEQHLGAEEIGARFGVTPAVVRQRLKLATVSPKLISLYRTEEMTLDQLMAFTVSDDHERQEAVWNGLTWNKNATLIRKALMETNVPATDRRVRFIGTDAYGEAGGTIIRDLFTEDGGGWFADPSLLDRLVSEKLAAAAADLQASEGWKWVEVLDERPHSNFLRVYPKPVELSDEDKARVAELATAYDALVEEWQAVDELPEEIAAQFAAMDAELAAFGDGEAYDPEDIARAGAFMRLDYDGDLRIERGFVRPEDDLLSPEEDEADTPPWDEAPEAREEEAAEDDADAPALLSDRLVADLSAHRTAALRDRLAAFPDVALVAVLHALALQSFHRGQRFGTCLELNVASPFLGSHADGIGESIAQRSIDVRHDQWAKRLPQNPRDLWDAIVAMDEPDQRSLLAHCVGLSVNAVQATQRPSQAAIHADQLAQATELDMRRYWRPTVASFFGRVSKAQILAAVREGYSAEAAERINGLKKVPMAEVAEEALSPRGWLPAILRTEGQAEQPSADAEPNAPLAAE